MNLRLGTRASPLALWQASWVAQRLADLGAKVELVHVTTSGDRKRESAIPPSGDTGMFTKELQRVLLAGEIDLAVHSLKDLPTQEVPGLVLAAVPARGPSADALLARGGETLASLPRGSVVATSSVRRQAQVRHLRPDLQIQAVRGNIETRLKQLAEGRFHAMVLAEAGLRRLELADRLTDVLAPPVFFPAPGQGALGIEARDGDAGVLKLLAPLEDAPSRAAVTAERSLLAELHGGCLAPIAAWARLVGPDTLALTGVVLSHDGRTKLIAEHQGSASRAHEVAVAVARALVSLGALELIQGARSHRA